MNELGAPPHRGHGPPAHHDLPWGSHACLLYESREALLSSLAAFFRTGLRRNEYCLWMTSEPLPPEEARSLLVRSAPSLEHFTRTRQLEIRDARSWYASGGRLDASDVIASWIELEKHVRSRGYSGLRVTGDTSWVDAPTWKDFLAYEARVTDAVVGLRVVGLCTYDVRGRDAGHVEEITCRHSFAFRPAPPGAAPAVLADVLRAGTSERAPAEVDWARLVRAVAHGDELALHELYDRAHRPVFTLALRLGGSREVAEQLTLDVFHEIWRRADRYDPTQGTVLGWIMNLARTRAIEDRLDRRTRRTPEKGIPAVNGQARPDDAAALRRRLERLRVALGTLHADDRRAIEAAFFSEETHAEVMARTGAGSLVARRMRIALDELSRRLDDGEPEDE